MKTIRVMVAILFLLASTAPSYADFQYTDSSQITGGALIKMVKAASVFARGDAKKQQQQALQPTTTTHYVKGNRLRIDNADGTSQIIDLDGRRVIMIDRNKNTYAVATFDQIKAALDQAAQQVQQAQQNAQRQLQQAQGQVQITPTVHVTPGAGNRVILNQSTNETKVEMDLTMQATGTGPNAPAPGQPAAATYAMNMDTFIAPNVAGYQEFAQFYRRMAQDVNWMKLPSAMNISEDPRVSQGMSELQRNSDALKGFPLLSYISMTIVVIGPDGKPITVQTAASDQQAANSTPPPPANTSNSSDNSIPTNPRDAVVKGLGGLFGRKKKDDSSAQANQTAANSSQAGAAPANPNSDPNALMEMTTQVTSFSDSSLDGGLFDVPAGYTQIQEDPASVFGGRAAQQQQGTK